jgi:DNA primase
VIAPDSENTVIKAYIIENLKTKYKKIITLFDNDDAGHKAIERYAKAYNINGTALTICKDISDAVKEHGFEQTHQHLKPLLKEALYKV